MIGQIRFFNRELRAARKLFSQDFYVSTYDDINLSSGMKPFEHYMKHGWMEGRDPSANFSAIYYSVMHLDGGFSENPLLHYVKVGRAKGAICKPETANEFDLFQMGLIRDEFDEDFYRKSYSDCGVNALYHYYTASRAGDLRNPNADFKSQSYLDSHQSLHKMDIDLFAHYIVSSGNRKHDRSKNLELSWTDIEKSDSTSDYKIIEPFFDQSYYLNNNEDVRLAGIDPISHYVRSGWHESRNPNPLFWSSYYLSQNFDVTALKQNPFVHYIKYGRAENRRANPIGDKLWNDLTDVDKLDWSKAPIHRRSVAKVLVIMPVYKGRVETLNAIYALLNSASETKFHLIVILDATPDKLLYNDIVELAKRNLFTIILNEHNLGFVGSTNKGLSMVHNEDVVLLNSDAIVFNDWLDRMYFHSTSRSNVATITPFSNNATIFSYPDHTQNNLIALEIDGKKLDSICSAANHHRSLEVPTGVGFCMYITNPALKSVGLLDEESFGKGYGEENDFCMRARQKGLINLHAEDVFVYHKGQVSFGAFSSDRGNAAEDALTKKHPDYLPTIRRYIKSNPARNARRRIDAMRLANEFDKHSVIFIYVRNSGGTKLHIDQVIDRLMDETSSIICVELDNLNPPMINLRIIGQPTIYAYNPFTFDIHEDIANLFFKNLRPMFVHLHSVGGMTSKDLTRLHDLISMTNCPAYFTIHDFNAICLRSNFIREDGVFCANSCHLPCLECSWSDKLTPSRKEIERRHNAFRKLLGSMRCIAPSSSAKDRFAQAYPDLNIMIRPHWPQVSRINARPRKPNNKLRRIAVVGAIGVHKGSDLIYAAAQAAISRSLPIEFKLIGHSDISDIMPKVGINQTGDYPNEQAAFDLIERMQPDAIWLPSICPETYGYTLNLAFLAQIPPIVFDTGALAERVREIDWGFVIDHNLGRFPNELVDTLLELPLENAWTRRSPVKFQRYGNLLREYYSLGSK